MLAEQMFEVELGPHPSIRGAGRDRHQQHHQGAITERRSTELKDVMGDEVEAGQAGSDVGSSTGQGASEMIEKLGGDLDIAINPWSLVNMSLPLSYFCVGFAMSFVDTPLKVYAVNHLNVGAERLQVLKTVRSLPWSFKILDGLLTDCVPIRGMRRKPYFIIGWILYSLAGVSLALLRTPSIHHLVLFSFLAAVGFILADVAADSLVVERSRLEPHARLGHFQSMVFIMRHAGSFTGHILGTLVYNKAHWGWGMEIYQVFWMWAAMPMVFVIPLAYFLVDPQRFLSCRSVKLTLDSLWLLVRRRTVWKPMSFVAWYNLCHIPNAAWEPFLLKGLHFMAFQLGILSTAAAAFSFAGVAFYRAFMMQCNWRTVYILTSICGTMFSIMQLLLVFRVNVKWHMSDLLFAMGDEVIGDFIMAMHFLPLVNMMLMLCPEGAEGTSFAMVTTLNNVAKTAASNVGTLLVRIWDVSNKSLKHHNYDGLWRLTLLTSMIQIAGLFPVGLLPKGKDEMIRKKETIDFWGGMGLLGFLVAAWMWTISQSISIMRKEA